MSASLPVFRLLNTRIPPFLMSHGADGENMAVGQKVTHWEFSSMEPNSSCKYAKSVGSRFPGDGDCRKSLRRDSWTSYANEHPCPTLFHNKTMMI
ncbi:hypothetical protein JTE90_026502 [Oedothorax gibbosus]|uniref:Uncharacterized protein n=1 Tax=Oedothorax gibbosus TaxID=931172 RepID=A0AAV6VR22_9ARAC|nr:hypothetical protein JTE90_026502 [Oedothorax gibbosus]